LNEGLAPQQTRSETSHSIFVSVQHLHVIIGSTLRIALDDALSLRSENAAIELHHVKARDSGVFAENPELGI
jgi:hypothetical protein